ncbi:MAG: hypothetical protein Q4C37_04390 [Bacteroidales bacterium]|nr:hypothetical protein [Bacteroidales bacterium]
MEKDIRNIAPTNESDGMELISANGLNMYDFGANPSDTTTTKAKGINIHKPGSDNLTKFTRTKLPISMGCLLIDIERWDSFIGIFNNPDQRKNTVGILIQR